MSLNNNLVLFGSKRADNYLKSEIYDPDIDKLDPNQSGKIVPAVGSIVADDTSVETGFALYTVVALDPDTLKATLAPSKIISTEDGGPDRIIGYGNDNYMLNYNDRVTPSELYVDDKFVLYGLNSASYRLLRVDADNRSTVISLNVNGNMTSYRYYRLEITAANSSAAAMVGELKLYFNGMLHVFSENDVITASSAATSYPVANATDNISPVADANCWKSNATPSVGTPQYIQICLASAQYLTSYAVVPAPTSYGTNSPYTWKMKGSQDGTTWYDVDTRTEVGWPSAAPKTFFPNYGSITNTIIPIRTIQNNNYIRKCSNCKTTTALADNEIILMEIFNQANILTTIVRLIAKRATALADQEISTNPIVEFRVGSSQMDVDGSWYLFTDQTTNNLAIHASLVYADGTEVNVTQNYTQCFIYGLEQIKTSYPGMQYKVLIKYFITDLTPSLIAQGKVARYLSQVRTVTIRNRPLQGISKISVVPLWSNNQWTLKYFAYSVERNAFSIISANDVTWVGTPFNGSNVTTRQDLTLNVNETLSDGSTHVYEQTISIRLASTSAVTPFLYAPTSDALLIYGSATLPYKRPLINYNLVSGQYYIPSTRFTSVAEFLNNFYLASTPPYLAVDETEAPTPTHFRIRESSVGTAILADAIPVADYATAFNLITSGGTGQYTNSTVIVEFLLQQNAVYSILYGVPVEVKTA